MRSVGIVSGKKMRGGGKSQASCASDSSSLPNSLGCGSLRSKGAQQRCQVFECQCPGLLSHSLDGKQSCVSKSVPLSTLTDQ